MTNNIVNTPSADVSMGVRVQVTNGRNQIQRNAGAYNALYMGSLTSNRIYEFYLELGPGEAYTSNPGEEIATLVVSTGSPLRFDAVVPNGALSLNVRKALIIDQTISNFTLRNEGTTRARVYMNIMTQPGQQPSSEITIFWGVALKPSVYDEAFIRGLSGSGSGGKNRTFEVDAGPNQYIYYCYPSALGESQFEVNTFIGGINQVATALVELEAGPTEFNIYESEWPNLGLTTVKVIPG